MDDHKNPNAKELEEMVESISEWLSKQPHLPFVKDKRVLRKFIVNCKYRLQKTKTKLDNYYSARTKLPSVFQNRDPSDEDIRFASKATPFFPLPKRTPNGHKVMIVKMSPNPDDFIPAVYIKRMFMVFDVMFWEEEEEEEKANLDYCVVVDFDGFTLRHFIRLTTIAKLFMDIVQNVNPATLQAVHYVNVPPFVDKVVEFFKMIVTPKLRDRFYVHTDINTFYDAVGDRDILPHDLGGKDRSVAELSDSHQKTLEFYKSWFEKEESIRSREDLRPTTLNSSWLMGTEGSFKRLTVD